MLRMVKGGGAYMFRCMHKRIYIYITYEGMHENVPAKHDMGVASVDDDDRCIIQ